MITKNCLNCRKDFMHRACPSDLDSGRAKYCSRECTRLSQWKLPKSFKCLHCSTLFQNKFGKLKKFCSKKCADKFRIGSVGWGKGRKFSKETREKQSIAKIGHIPWNKGLKGVMPTPWNKGCGVKSSLNSLIRESEKMKEWKRNILERDLYVCQECGQGIKHNGCVHHIYQFHHIMKEFEIDSVGKAEKCKKLWDIKNGITLCVPCHKDVHKRYNQVGKIIQELQEEGYLLREERKGKRAKSVWYKLKTYNIS